MLTFLRKIRKSFIESGAVKKYLLYAIGEIALVVIGILIALQINLWNESKKDRRAENEALINLKLEFDENQKRMAFLMDVKQQQEDECRAYLELVTNDDISIDDKIKADPPNTFAGTWGATNTVLQSLQSTGGIEKIQNDSLKFLLNHWPVLVNRYVQREKRFEDELNDLFLFENDRIPRNIVNPGTHRDIWPGDYLPNDMEVLRDSLIKELIVDFRYQNFISTMANTLYIQLILATDIQDNYESITRLIVAELKNRGIDAESIKKGNASILNQRDINSH